MKYLKQFKLYENVFIKDIYGSTFVTLYAPSMSRPFLFKIVDRRDPMSVGLDWLLPENWHQSFVLSTDTPNGSWYQKKDGLGMPIGKSLYVPDYNPDNENTIEEDDYVDFGRNKIGKCYHVFVNHMSKIDGYINPKATLQGKKIKVRTGYFKTIIIDGNGYGVEELEEIFPLDYKKPPKATPEQIKEYDKIELRNKTEKRFDL